MKFELEPDNRNCADDVLLDDLREVAARLGETQLSQDQYNRLGRFHSASIKKRFGRWNKALEKAGLTVNKWMNLSKEECLVDLQRVAASLNKNTVTRDEYTQFGQFSEAPFVRLFGSWRKAHDQAGLMASRLGPRRYPNERLFEIFESVWRAVGRQPRQSDFKEPLSPVGPSAFTTRFGSWRKALEAFIEYVNATECEPDATSNPDEKTAIPNHAGANCEGSARPKTPRNPSWRLRFLVMRRDAFRCCICGRSPATVHGLVLVVDHKHPWSKGGETIMENLQTLCLEDNGGKSDLSMTEDKVRG